MFIKLLKIIWPEYWFKSLLIIFILLINAFLASVSVLSIVPFLSQISGTEDSQSKILAVFEVFFSFLNLEISTGVILGFVASILILKSFFKVFSTYLFEWIRLEIDVKYKKIIYESLLSVRTDYLLKNNYGKLTNITVLETKFIGQLVTYLSIFLSSFVELIFFTILIFFLSTQLTLVAVLIVFIFYFSLRGVYKGANSLGTDVTNINNFLQSHVNYTLTGYRTLKSLSGENRYLKFLNNLLKNYRTKFLRLTVTASVLNSLFEPLVLVVIFIIFFALSPSESTLIIFIAAIAKMYTAVRVLQNQFFKLMQHLPSLDIFQNALIDLNKFQYDDNKSKKSFLKFKDKIQFKNIEYSYTDKERDFKLGPIKEFSIHRGDTIALVGPSGSGKSTILDLLEGFIFPSKGIITIDGVDLKKLNTTQYRNKIGYVSQDSFFLNDTVKNNISFGNEEISCDEIIKALDETHALQFVDRLPEGINTVIGEQGARFSGGQKQRISLARALVKKPEILILDEATSALDNETEQKVWQTIEKLKEKMTVIIIAHKLSFINKVDNIFVIENGKFVENGTFKELINKKGRFYKFYRSG